MIYTGRSNEFIQLEALCGGESLHFDSGLHSPLVFVWIIDGKATISYDGEPNQIEAHTILCLTEFHRVTLTDVGAARMIKFNREFYCVLNHDREVSCKGVLFYTAGQLPMIAVPEHEREKFEVLWRMFQIEMQSRDDLQLEMLQTMLKRFIILCTRLYKSGHHYLELVVDEQDILREFSYLVETHYKQKHTVQDYAGMLNKSPKTVSNLFSKVSDKTPLQIIHERIVLEARRLLRYTDKSVKEIAYELGFEDIQAFSRFFKKIEGNSPSDYRNSVVGRIANTAGRLA